MLGLCLSGGGVGAADAEPRRIAIVNLAHDQEAGARLAREVRTRLILTPDVMPLAAGEAARALEDALASATSDANALAAAQGYLAYAREELAQFEYDSASAQLDIAESRLLATWPSLRAFQLLADVCFERGVLLVRAGRVEEALAEFVAVHRLDPKRGALNPARYLPAVVETFDDAALRVADPGSTATLRVTSPLDGAPVYVNGRYAGTTPIEVALAPGVHYVTGTFADRHIDGQRIEIGRKIGQAEHRLLFERYVDSDRARQWRRTITTRRSGSPARGDGAQTGPDLEPSELFAAAMELGGTDGVIVIADDREGDLYLAVYDGYQPQQTGWVRADAATVEARARRLARVVRPAPPGPRLLPPEEPDERDDRYGWVAPAALNTAVGVGLAAAIIYAVLRGPSGVVGTCCSTSGVSALGGSWQLHFP
ncbi:MAG: hypothetical protein Tsb0020_45520 [Haliangiales bacterium]